MTLQRYLTRLIWWCVTPLLALAIGLGYLQFREASDDDGAEAQRLARLLARSVEQMLHARRTGLQALAASPWIDDATRWPDLRREAEGIAKALGGPVLLVDPERRVQMQAGALAADLTQPLPLPAGRSALRIALATGLPAVSDPFTSAFAPEPVVTIAVPVPRAQHVAYLVAHLMPLAHLQPLLGELALPEGWSVSVQDSTGQAFVQRGGAIDDTGLPLVQAVLRFSDRPASVPWSIEVHVPRETYAQHLWSVASLLVLVMLGVTLVSVLGGMWATQRLARAVRSLADPAPGPAGGNDLLEIRQTRHLLEDARAQREAATEALREREAQLRAIFESASEVIITVDASQTIALANPSAARVFGRRVDQLVGMPLDALLPPRLRAAHRAHVENFGRSDATARAMDGRPVVLGLRADGSEFPIEAAISHVLAGGQQLYTVILRDISDRIAAEQAIAAGKARLEATLESLDDGLVIADTGLNIVEVNAALLRLYGFSTRAECLRPIFDYQALLELRALDGRVLTLEQWSMPRALRGERASGVELEVYHKATGRRWIGSFSFAPILDDAAKIIGGVCSVRDVTEKKRLADELKASHRDLERLVASQSSIQEEERKRIARELHDELQQVLAAIKMDIALILPELAADPARLPALVTRMDDLATAAITSSRRIVNDLRPQLLEEFGLVPALELLASQFMERLPIRVAVESDPGCRAAGAAGDSVALCLYRVAQEALNNVAKHARARRAHIRLKRTPGGGWLLRVADDGRGLDVKDLAKTGSFGLRGMTERVRALGGTLRVGSTPGRGVVVTVEVPAAAVPDAGD
ncbi:PAS domain S-box protein [Rubrivivax sp. RP6-9]|uniref:sensor histidine kinase n=1 Tax=Rubrivivax sp. RP6-9 TaxID=3415750 RepID=UPI003CC5C023